jgi:ribosome recycling factor
MNRIHARIRDLTDRRRRAGIKDIREVIEDLNPVSRVREIRTHGLRGGFRSPGSQEHRA